MHLGNVMCALLSWLSVKSRGGQWLLRIEDLDSGRSRRAFAEQIEDDLKWLGLLWDEGGLEGRGANGPYLQSQREEIYEEHLKRLIDKEIVYPCHCTRADIMATQAPHESDGRIVYSGACRPAWMSERYGLPHSGNTTIRDSGRKPSLRLLVPDEEIAFNDMHYGPAAVNLARHCGDFVLRRGDGAWAYQLAVVVDDALMGVGEVVRGRDLLLSSPQQIYLYRLLGYEEPTFCHLPLLCNESGERLCKRDKSLDMGELRKTHSPEQLIGRLAHLCGLLDRPESISPSELLSQFSWDKVPTEDIIIKKLFKFVSNIYL